MVEQWPTQTIDQLLHEIFFYGVFLAPRPDKCPLTVKTDLLDASPRIVLCWLLGVVRLNYRAENCFF